MSKFITIEGLDSAGKTTVIIPHLKEKLNSEKTVFVADLKTGPISKKIRDIFMDHTCVDDDTDRRTVALLAATARSELVTRSIIPALSAGKNVVCDRYVDTSYVYNSKSHLAPIDTIFNLSTHLIYPDVIIFAYCSFEEMLYRNSKRDDTNQWDIANRNDYNDLLNRYREQFKTRPNKVIEIDTSGSVYDVHNELNKIIKDIFA